MKKIITVLALFAIVGFIALSLTACGKTTTTHVSSSTSAVAKSDAKALTKCLPQSSLAQVKLIKSLATHSGREALIGQCGIPPQNKDKAEAQILGAAEVAQLQTKAGRDAFIGVTLPKIIEANQV